ncbi:MAG: zinc ribbon domain-containing protein [Candidatus Riflebacteria bacterium]|nr:zinc ribbon domain-containing protein [Candidatus Riflebacteria bacterium]
MKRFALIMVMLLIVSPSYALFCQDCGTQVSETANFCSQCGNRITGAFPASQEMSEYAPPPIQHSAGFALQVPTRSEVPIPTFHVNPSGLVVPAILSGLRKTLLSAHFPVSTPLLGLALLASIVQSSDRPLDNGISVSPPLYVAPEADGVVIERGETHYPIWGAGCSQVFVPSVFQENPIKVVVSDHYGSFSRPNVWANRIAQIPYGGTYRSIQPGHRYYTEKTPIIRGGSSASPRYRTAHIDRAHDSRHAMSGHPIVSRSSSGHHRGGNRRFASSR